MLIYDPLVAVDHYPAQRFDEDQRQQFNALALVNAVHNETLALLEHLSVATDEQRFYSGLLGVGTRASPGLLQWLRFLPQEGTLSQQKWFASLQGRWQGWQTWRSSPTHPPAKML